MTKWATYLSAMFLLATSSAIAGDEFVIVSGQHGYLLNDSEQVVDSVIMGAMFRVSGSQDDYLIVKHLGEERRIHKLLCIRSSDWDYVNDDNFDFLFESLKLLEHALREEDLGNSDRAMELMRSAAARFDDPIGKQLPLHTWIRQFEAYLQYAQDNFDKANAILAASDAELKEIGGQFGSFGADLLNTRALVRSGEGKTDEALKLHKQALKLAQSERPRNHVDLAILNMNLSEACSAVEDYDGAIASQAEALEISKVVYPASAKEIAVATMRLADTNQDAERYEEARRLYQTGLRNLIVYHPHLIYEIAAGRESLADVHRSLGDYESSEKVCHDLIKSLRKLPFADDIAYRKSTYQRLALIDYDQENYTASLQHCEDAIALTDMENFELADGYTFEFSGDAFVGLSKPEEATAAYEQAVEIYVDLEGADSENLVTVRESLAQLDINTANALDAIVVAATPRAYLLDENDNIITLIPGLTVLKSLSTQDSYHEVEFAGQTGRVLNTQLRVGRQIPGYGSVTVEQLESVMANVAGSIKAFEDGKQTDVQQFLANGKQICDSDSVQESTLDYWHRLHVLSLLGRLGSLQGVFEKVEALEASISSFDDNNSYPIKIDYESTAAFFLSYSGQPVGVEHQRRSLRLTEQLFGKVHSATRTDRGRLAKILFAMGDHENSIREFDQMVTISRQIFPPQTPEIKKAIADMCLAIINTQKSEAALEALERLLKDRDTLSFQSQSFATAMLGKVYAEHGNSKAARTLLSVIIDLTQNKKDVPILGRLQAYMHMGKLEISENNWNAAIAVLKECLAIHKIDKSSESFAASEVHRLLADAYEGAGDSKSAADHLQSVLKLYDTLGGSDSPQAGEIRKRLQSMGSSPPAEEPSREAQSPVPDIAQYFNFSPNGEQMMVAKQSCSVFADAAGVSERVIGEIKATGTVWSLEERDGKHRIYLEDESKFGWVKAGDVSPQIDALTIKTFSELDEKAGSSDSRKKDVATIKSVFESVQQTESEGNLPDIKMLENAVRLLKKHDQDQSYPYAIVLGELASRYANTGAARKAAELIDDQLTPLDRALGYRHPLCAANRLHRAADARNLGNFLREASELSTIVKICEKHFGPDDPRTQFQRMSLTSSKVREGYFDDAREAYNRQLEQEALNGTPTLTLAVAHLGLAGLDAMDGADKQAAQHAEDSLDALRDLKFPIPNLTAQALIVLARSIAQDGEFDEALGLLEQVQTLASLAVPEAKLLTLVQQSTIAAYANQHTAAAEFAQQADDLAIEKFGTDHYRRHDALQAKGRALHHEKPNAAAVNYEKARRFALDYINDSVAYQSKDSQISFLHADELWLEEALSVSADGKSAIEETATWMLNFHNLLPRVLARDRQARALVEDRPDYNALILSGGARTDRVSLPLYSQAQAQALQIEKIVAQFASEEQSRFRSMSEPAKKVISEPLPWITPAEIRKQLAGDEALVMIREVRPAYSLKKDPFGGRPPSKFDGRTYMAWIVTGKPSDSVQAFELAADTKSLQPQINAVTRFVSDIDDISLLPGSPKLNTSSSFENALKQLSRNIWRPIGDRLPSSIHQVTLCLDGSLHRIPWEALPTQNGRVVLEDFTMRYVTSPRDLLSRSTSSQAGPAAMLAESAPNSQDNLNSYFPDVIDHVNRQTNGSSHPFTSVIRNKLLDMTVLPAAGGKDAVKVGVSFAKAISKDAKVYSGSEASEIRYYSLNNPRGLHIGAYSLVTPKDKLHDFSFALSQSRKQIGFPSKLEANPLLRCSLAMAGFNIKDTPQHLLDGVLTGEEIVTNDLSATELVTLSHGARQAADVIDDASLLLPQAFLLAGAHSVVAPQWQTDQEASLEVLKLFYDKLIAGKSKAEALQAAQLEFRADLKRRGGAHPMYWAAFRLTGQR